MHFPKNFSFQQIPLHVLELGCLVLVGVLEIFPMIFSHFLSGASTLFLVGCQNAVAALFVGITFREHHSRESRKLFLIFFAMMIWTGFLQILDLKNFEIVSNYLPRFALYTLVCEYGMMLPMGCLLKGRKSIWGIEILGTIFIAGTFLLSFLTILLYMNITPGNLSLLLHWWGSQLSLMWNPNILAHILLIGMTFSMILVCIVKPLWAKVLLGFHAVVEFLLLSVTDSLSTILMACCLLGGLAFFLSYKSHTFSLRKFLISILIALLVISLLFMLSSAIYKGQILHLSTSTKNPQEIIDDAHPSSLRNDFKNFSGRSVVWRCSFLQIFDHPSILLLGNEDIGALISAEAGRPISHSHNAWLQALMGLGIPGLAIALYITCFTIKNCFILCFLRDTKMYQKIVCLFLLALMGTQFCEPYIFYAEFPANFTNMVFLFFVGYTVYWVHNTDDLSKPEEDKILSAE